MAAPLISVLMPAYNAERYVAEAVQSILDQTFTDFEFLIVDDGSTDSTRAILERSAARDARIQLVSRPNTGYLVALNEMIARARGEFLARMDADDIAEPQRFERQMSYLAEHPDCVLVGSRVLIIDPDGDPLRIMGDALSHEEIDSAMLAARGQMVYHPSVIVRKRAMERVGGYREEYLYVEDLDVFLKLAEIGRIANLAEPLLRYREHLGKVGRRLADLQRERIQLVLTEAHRRRGLPAPTRFPGLESAPPGPAESLRIWGWWALGAGHVRTARKHALRSARRQPLSLESWRLLYCSLRGR